MKDIEEVKRKLKVAEARLEEAMKRKAELDEIRKDLNIFYVSDTKAPLDLPYVPSSAEKVITMIELADIKPGQKVADLGSGDGRVLIAMAKKGAFCFGFEIEPKRVELARKNIRSNGLSEKIIVFNKNFFDINLNKYDVITLYGITSIMGRLERKMMDELRPGTRVISNRFNFPNWKEDQITNDVFLYIKK